MFLDLVLSVLAGLQGPDAYILFFALVFGAGIAGPISEDALLLAAATFAAQGGMHPLPMMVVAWVALLAGDALTFWTGRHWGARWVRRPWAQRFVPPERLPALEQGTRRFGPVLAFVTRFLPGQRTTLFFIFGTLRMPYATFFLFDGVAALVYVPVLVVGARVLGWDWQRWRGPLDSVDNWLTLLSVIVIVGWCWNARRHRTA
jgi:membrane protein DedA with SNARE-associated domain